MEKNIQANTYTCQAVINATKKKRQPMGIERKGGGDKSVIKGCQGRPF